MVTDGVAQEHDPASDWVIGDVHVRICGAVCGRVAQVVLGRRCADILCYAVIIDGDLKSEQLLR